VLLLRAKRPRKKMFYMKVLGRYTYADNLLAVCWRSATEKIRTAKLAKLVVNLHLICKLMQTFKKCNKGKEG